MYLIWVWYEMKLGVVWFVCVELDEVDEFLGGFSDNVLVLLLWLFEFWVLFY